MNFRQAIIVASLVGTCCVSISGEPSLTFTAPNSTVLVGAALSGSLRYDGVDWGRISFTRVYISVQQINQGLEDDKLLTLYPVLLSKGEFLVSYSSSRGSGVGGFPGAFAYSPEADGWTLIFSEPGNYRMTFYVMRGDSKLASNPVDVEVKMPTGRDLAAWHDLPVRAYTELLIYDGPRHDQIREEEITTANEYKMAFLKGYRALNEHGHAFVEWLRKHKESVYARQIIGGVRGSNGHFFPDRGFWDEMGVPFPAWIDEANRLIREITVEPIIMRDVLTEDRLRTLRQHGE